MMGDSSQKISGRRIFVGILAIVAILSVGGCADSFAEKPTSQQSQAILDDVSKIETAPEPNIPVPEVYSQPPKIVEQLIGGTPEFKLFYFCKYHTSDQLREIVHAQFATKLFKDPKKDQVTSVPDYTVSSNPATNQLIVRCPARQDVEAVLELLQQVDVPPVQVKIDCLVSEVYADKTLDHSTSLKIQELFGEDIWVAPSGLKFSDVTATATGLEEAAVLPAFPGAVLRDVARARMGLTVGYWKTGKYMALVDLLESQGYLKILMNPTLEVINGKKATVRKSEKVPLQKITTIVPGAATGGWGGLVHEETEYVDVVDSLEITPRVFADETIGLETSIVLGSKLTPEGVKQLPIVTKKEINNAENRIRRGESLVIGGIRKNEKRDVIRGIPFFKDLPVVGILFSGRDFEERVIETIFILTPTISTGGIPKQEMVEEVKRKHAPPVSGGLYDTITDPFGSKARQKEQQRKAGEAEQIRLEAEVQKAQARRAIREVEERAERAEEEAQRAKAELNRVKTEAEAKVKAAEKARKEAEAKTNAAEKAEEETPETKPKVQEPEAKESEAEAKAEEA